MVNLREKKTNGKTYYYLEHTIRKGKKFLNKRKYLGVRLPKNITQVKEEFIVEIINDKYGTELEKIGKEFQTEFSKFPQTAKEKYIESFMIRFTYDTNRIEGSTLTLKETADLLQEHITPSNKPIDEVKETEAHKIVFYEMLGYKKELSLQVVLDWHRKLFINTKEDIAGKIRKHQVAIARSKTQLPFPAEIDILLREFFTWYKENKNKMNPTVLAALVHLKFVTIHPFTDGNGRISRLLMNFVLQKNGYPMLNIEYKNRNSYYDALEKSQVKKNELFFLQFLVKRYLKTYKTRKFS